MGSETGIGGTGSTQVPGVGLIVCFYLFYAVAELRWMPARKQSEYTV